MKYLVTIFTLTDIWINFIQLNAASKEEKQTLIRRLSAKFEKNPNSTDVQKLIKKFDSGNTPTTPRLGSLRVSSEKFGPKIGSGRMKHELDYSKIDSQSEGGKTVLNPPVLDRTPSFSEACRIFRGMSWENDFEKQSSFDRASSSRGSSDVSEEMMLRQTSINQNTSSQVRKQPRDRNKSEKGKERKGKETSRNDNRAHRNQLKLKEPESSSAAIGKSRSFRIQEDQFERIMNDRRRKSDSK